ncbi:hypothetical protein [Polyangium mundeleinium]|uniref:PEGA domain-containing protein n=1 Tax=Polyangium mundeleinium TaxID=2995306 RepID=A0ABT5F2W3_9BACT|nr:hypothetical protein [Polyangium mundeleinium]MDC0747738.1 hypothetical protein [Polyangium mundeleinium]
MKYLLLASTVLLAVSVSSAALADEPDDPGAATKIYSAPPPTEPIKVPEVMKIPYTDFNTDRALMTLYHAATRKRLLEAQALEKAGKTQEALETYQDAYAHQGLPDTQLELGFAQARAGMMLPCARNIQAVIAFWTLRDYALHPVEEVRSVLAYCAKRVGTIALRVNIPGARITVDGELVMDWPYHDEFYVEPGGHEIKANASGYWMNETHVDIKAGERKELRIAMQQRIHSQYVAFPAAPMNVSIHANISRTSKDDPPTWPKGLMVASGVGMGLGVAGLATGLVFVNNAESKSSAATWTGVAAAGGMLLGLGVTGLIIGMANRPEPPPPNVIITPQFAKGEGGVQLSGTMP